MMNQENSNERTVIQQTNNFYGNIGQQINHVDKIEAHFDKDMGIMVDGQNIMPSTSSPNVEPAPMNKAESSFPLSPMDDKIFHSSIDMDKLKGCIRGLGISPSERSNWCVVYLVLRENAIIASDATQKEFSRWARDVFGITSDSFTHCLDGAKSLPTKKWMESIVARKYICLAETVRKLALAHESFMKKDKQGNPLLLDSSIKWSKRNL